MRGSRRGFTVIELLLVIVILAMLATSIIPKVTAIFRVSVKSSVRRFSSIVKQTYDQAVLTGKIHRIVLKLGTKEDPAQGWTVESAESGALPSDPKRVGLQIEGKREEDRPTIEPAFKEAKEALAAEMPRGVRIVSVETQRLGDGVKADSGTVNLYAFPNGLLDRATVTFAEIGKEEMQRFRVTVNPLTGRISVETENVQQ
jgi:prepilin-type N-terminal cleavage/methylation domain-containing protein